jgi:hypothetical protein
MSDPLDPVLERVLDGLKRLQLLHLRETLSALLSEAAKAEWTYCPFKPKNWGCRFFGLSGNFRSEGGFP